MPINHILINLRFCSFDSSDSKFKGDDQHGHVRFIRTCFSSIPLLLAEKGMYA